MHAFRLSLKVISLGALALLLAACLAPIPEPVTLGAVYSLTGDQAGLDVPSAQGARLAVAEANDGEGVLSRPVRLILEDAETDAGIAAVQTARIAADHPAVAAFFGLSDTDLVLGAASAAADTGRVFLTSGATSPKLPADLPGALFMACFGDNVQAAAGAEWAYNQAGARSVSILYDEESTYTLLLHDYFQIRFQELGGEVRAVEPFKSDDPLNLAEAVARLQPADLVYLAARPDDALPGVLELRRAGFTAPILGGDGFDVAGLWEDEPNVADVFFTTHAYLGPDNDDPRVVAFRAAYETAFPGAEPDAFAALGYDAANLLMEAVRRAGSDDPDAVREALAGIRRFDGVTGELGFASGTQIPVKSVSILRVEDGVVGLAEQVMPEAVPAP